MHDKNDTVPIERHPLEPFLPPNARLLMLGSFPPPRKRWSMDFFYPNRTNMMWEIFGEVFYGDSQRLVDAEYKTFKQADIEALLNRRGIAIYDTATAVKRLSGNASDKDLEVVEKTDIAALLEGAYTAVPRYSVYGAEEYLGTGRGLWRDHPEDGRIQHFRHQWTRDATLAYALVVACLPDAACTKGCVLSQNDGNNYNLNRYEKTCPSAPRPNAGRDSRSPKTLLQIVFARRTADGGNHNP